MKRYAVIGNPIAHTRSPQIHLEFARQTGVNIEYTALWSPPDGFAKTVEAFRQSGGNGLSVTAPFKQEACVEVCALPFFGLKGILSPEARKARAVNTLIFRGDEIIGDNTDGAGLVNDLQYNLHFSLRDKTILILGAGGAACGIVPAILAEQPASITIVNRTPDKADQLVKYFKPTSQLKAIRYEELTGKCFDLVINATSSSLLGELPPLPQGVFSEAGLAYDLAYIRFTKSTTPTPFLEFAAAQGVGRTSDGLGMLVEQAAESFYIWHGVRPDSRSVIDELKYQVSEPLKGKVR